LAIENHLILSFKHISSFKIILHLPFNLN